MAVNYKFRYEAEKFRLSLEQISECDIAWFSGWLCADGSILHRKKRSVSIPGIGFRITDRDPLERFVDLFGGTVCGPYNRTSRVNSKPLYSWTLAGMKAVHLLKRCMPWLSLRYRERALYAVQYKHIPLPQTARSLESYFIYTSAFLTNLHPDELDGLQQKTAMTSDGESTCSTLEMEN